MMSNIDSPQTSPSENGQRTNQQHVEGNLPNPSQQISAERQPPSLPDAERRKRWIRFWTNAHNVLFILPALFLVFITGFLILGFLIQVTEFSLPQKYVDTFYMTLVTLMIPTVVAYALSLCFFVFSAWKEIPNIARITPPMMAGFMFILFLGALASLLISFKFSGPYCYIIPFFGLSWNFVAFRGLYLRMNKSLEQMEAEKHFPLNRWTGDGITGMCWLWLVFWILILLVWKTGVLSGLDAETRVSIYLAWSLFYYVYVIMTVRMFFRIRTDVIEFIDIKSRTVE